MNFPEELSVSKLTMTCEVWTDPEKKKLKTSDKNSHLIISASKPVEQSVICQSVRSFIIQPASLQFRKLSTLEYYIQPLLSYDPITIVSLTNLGLQSFCARTMHSQPRTICTAVSQSVSYFIKLSILDDCTQSSLFNDPTIIVVPTNLCLQSFSTRTLHS